MPINSVKQNVYSNHRIEAPDGTLLCRAGKSRTDWYLNRGLAEVVEDVDPFTIRLNFEPAGRGNVDNVFYLSDKTNQCVVCGSDDNYNQHHVVPRCYRRHFPPKYKSRSSHDVLILCIGCHVAYEREADKLKIQIGEEVGFSFLPKSDGFRTRKESPGDMARYAARVLLINRDRMPQERIEELEALVHGFTGKEVTTELLCSLTDAVQVEDSLESRKNAYKAKQKEQRIKFKKYAQHVVSCIDIDALIYRWRRHFVETMNPQFLPVGWDIENPTYCQLTNKNEINEYGRSDDLHGWLLSDE